VHATAGNISVRLPDGQGYLITPTDACLGFLQPDRLAQVAPDGTQIAGDRASKTLALHRRIYGADPDARCIIHTHSTHLVALTLAGVWSDHDILPPITPYYVMKVGHVPLIPYHRPVTRRPRRHRVARAHRAAAARTRRAHPRRDDGPPGPQRLARVSPAAAMAVLEELEETARLWLMTRAAPLDAGQIEELRQHFGARW
jgi:ribulose-5-phosphate 4-epimerase/fuculose-1-phosphate aldolase